MFVLAVRETILPICICAHSHTLTTVKCSGTRRCTQHIHLCARTTPNVRLFCTHRKCGRNGASSVRKFPFAHAFLMIPAGIVRRARTKTPTPTKKNAIVYNFCVCASYICLRVCESRRPIGAFLCPRLHVYNSLFGGSWLVYGRI